MLGFKNQVIGNYGMMVHVTCVFSWTDLLFLAFVGSLCSIWHFQAKVNGNIFCYSSGFKNKPYIKGWKMSKSVSNLILFVSLKYNGCLLLWCDISTLFMSTTVFLPNYSSDNTNTNSIQPVSACLAFFDAIWHFLQVFWHFLFTWTQGRP